VNNCLDPYVYCGHGKKYKGEDCPECEQAWNEECLQRAYGNVVRYSNALGIPYPSVASTYAADRTTVDIASEMPLERWRATDYGDVVRIEKTGPHTGRIVTVARGMSNAHAHLIAAAPQLLNALKKLSFAAQITGGVPGAGPNLQEAIAESSAAIQSATNLFTPSLPTAAAAVPAGGDAMPCLGCDSLQCKDCFTRHAAEIVAGNAEPAAYIFSGYSIPHRCSVWPPTAEEIEATRDGSDATIQPLYTAPAPMGGVTEGWKLVPVEPTPEMREAWATYKEDCQARGIQKTAAGHYRAMIAAAPTPPAAQAQDAGLMASGK
jgi:hypothetical protein